MKKFISIFLCLLPLALLGQSYDVRQIVSGNNVLTYRGATPVNPNGYYNVLDYGAIGDSTTLDQTACQDAIDACPTNGTVFLPHGVYRVNYLVITRDINLIGDGAKLVGTASSAGHYLIEMTGHLSDHANLTSNAAVEDNHVHATSTKFVTGDYVVVADTTCRYTTHGRNQEFNRVLSVSTGIVNLTNNLIRNYTTANSAKIYKYSPVKNVVIQGLSLELLIGQEGGGIKLDYCYNVKVSNCNIANAYSHSIYTLRSTDIDISSCTAKNGQNMTNSYGYGYYFGESAHHCTLINSVTENVRESTVGDNSRFIKIANNTFKNSYCNGINVHGTGSSFIDIIGNTIEGGCVVSGGIVVGQYYNSAIDSAVLVEDNIISNLLGCGIIVEGSPSYAIRSVSVRNNHITNFGLINDSNQYGITTEYSYDVDISGNTISGENIGVNYGIFAVYGKYTDITNNKIKDIPNGYGINTDASNYTTIKGNVLRNISSYNIRSRDAGTHIFILNNITDDNSNDLIGTETLANNTWGW